MRTTNDFLVVLRIIFNTRIENYFFIVLLIIFRCIANLFLGLQCFAGLAVKVDWFESLKTLKWRKNCQGKKQKGFSSFLQNLSRASSLCVRDEVFWTEDLIYTILTLIEHDMSAQVNSPLSHDLIPRVFVLQHLRSESQHV